MKLLTEELKKQLPPLYSQQNENDPLVVCKFFHPLSPMTWYAIEGSPVDADGYYDTDKEKVDFLFFGWVYSDFPEMGYFSLSEMEQIHVGGLGMERDLHFTPDSMLNKIMLIGNVGKDPDLQVTADGTPYARFSLAVNRKYKANNGEQKEETEWFTIVTWRQLAEICERYLHKGSKVYVEGRLTQRKYTGKDGIQRTSVEVIANDMQMLSPKQADAPTIEVNDPFLPDEL